MKKTLFILSCMALFWAASMAYAQDGSLKFDVSFQLAVLDMRGPIGEKPLGLGGRFGCRFSSLLHLDGEVMYFPENPSGNFGETLVLGGIRVGREFYAVGVFAKVRAGMINFGGRDFNLRLSEKTHPAFDLGVILEYYASRHVFLRMDIGDCIIPFGGTPAPYQSIYGSKFLGTTHNFLAEFGIGFYF
jgi:hypothetical protein